MQAFNLTIFGIIAVSLDAFLFFMQFECVCIPISTLAFGNNEIFTPMIALNTEHRSVKITNFAHRRV